MVAETLRIVCWKWGGVVDKKMITFSAQHVNVLASMLSRHLHRPYELICITDDPTDIDSSVRIVPLWDDLNDTTGCYRRLKIFSKEMESLIGKRIVSIDLDLVIKDDITNLFDRNEDFVIWGDHTRSAPYCGSFWMMTAGTREALWKDFSMTALPKSIRKLGTDQAWINYRMYPNEAMWTEADGIYNFRLQYGKLEKKNRRKRPLAKAVKARARKEHSLNPPELRGTQLLPENARLIFFNGKYDPSQTHLYKNFPWIEEHWR